MVQKVKQTELSVVLLVDDDMVSREVTATLITMGGHSVHTSEDGVAALRLLDSGACEPQIILMDAQMPGLSGVELIAQLKARSSAVVYVISGSGPSAAVLAAADGFLLKPFDSAALDRLLSGGNSQPPPHIDLDSPVISAQVLAKLRKTMTEKAIREIYLVMMADLATRIEALSESMAKGDWADVKRIGHSIKGGCGMVGAMQLAALGAQFEMLPMDTGENSRGNRSDNSADLLLALRAAAQGLESILSSEFPA